MTIAECVNAVATNPATPWAAGLAGGALLQKFFNVIGFVASFFQSKPSLVPELKALLDDIKNKQPILDNILVILKDLQSAPVTKAN